MKAEIGWRPQPGPQTRLLTCPVFDVFYGGARGGGKTDGVLGDWASHSAQYGEGAVGLMVRRNRTELIDTIERSKALYLRIGATFNGTENVWRMPGGGRMQFAHLESDADAALYQGRSLTRLYVEEIGQFPRPEPIMMLMACLRSSAGVPVGMRATGNPGGAGHTWVRARYIDPAPLGYEVITDPQTGLQRVFIPSRVSDNPALIANDPGYVARLRAVGSPALVKAWLDGDWSVIQGAFFEEFSLARHVIEPFEIPKHWVRFRGADWGSAAPFCVLWCAVSDGTLPEYPRDQLVVYREWYGMEPGRPNVGLKLTVEEVADGILEREAEGEQIDYSMLDPSAFAQHGGPSIGERFSARGVFFQRADNTRVGARGAMGGWDLVRQRLRGEGEGSPPMLVMFKTCTHLIRTLPALQHDMRRPEDVDSDGEDHAGDSLRYSCASRPWVRDAVKKPEPGWTAQGQILNIGAAIAERKRQRQEAGW
jgi:hypothetical protein